MSPLPFVEIVVFPVFISFIDISGWTNAILEITSSMYPVSVKSFFKNLYLTGVLKNKFLTVITVPTLHATSSTLKISPPSAITLSPVGWSSVLETNSTLAIAAILAKASPLNPIDLTSWRSSAERILLVACLSNAISTSSLAIPFPLSATLMYDIPPFFISTIIFVAPASIEFSTISFTTDAGLSITSPAAIWFIVSSSNNTIFPMFFVHPFLWVQR